MRVACRDKSNLATHQIERLCENSADRSCQCPRGEGRQEKIPLPILLLLTSGQLLQDPESEAFEQGPVECTERDIPQEGRSESTEETSESLWTREFVTDDLQSAHTVGEVLGLRPDELDRRHDTGTHGSSQDTGEERCDSRADPEILHCDLLQSVVGTEVDRSVRDTHHECRRQPTPEGAQTFVSSQFHCGVPIPVEAWCRSTAGWEVFATTAPNLGLNAQKNGKRSGKRDESTEKKEQKRKEEGRHKKDSQLLHGFE